MFRSIKFKVQYNIFIFCMKISLSGLGSVGLKTGTYRNPQRTNVVSPDFFLGQIWTQEPETNGVKIIELDSNSSNSNIIDDEDKEQLSHAWSYVNKYRFRMQESPKDDYEVNYKSREKQRQNTSHYNREASTPEDQREESCIADFLYSQFKESQNNDNFGSRHKVNYFTNTDPYPKTSDSSTDVEYIDPNDLKRELMTSDTDDRYYDEIMTCDSNIATDKRTIYIYSFQNKHLLTENYDMNVSNGSSSTNNNGSSSTDTDVEESVKNESNSRISSPIPDLYVPKLNLIQTPKLPTVTEITEPKNSKEKVKLKYGSKILGNGWFLNTSGNHDEYEHTQKNLISWMSLSPRGIRSRLRNNFCENCRHEARLQMVREASPIGPANTQTTGDIVKSTLPVVRDISPKGIVINQGSDGKVHYASDICKEKGDREKDKGEHVQNKHVLKPKIRISPKTSGDTIKIAERIVKLDSNNWIGDETIVLKRKSSSYQFQNTKVGNVCEGNKDDTSKRLWENNRALQKPAEWSAYYPVDNSVPSLHLSLETEIEEVTWFKRIIRCLKCFK